MPVGPCLRSHLAMAAALFAVGCAGNTDQSAIHPAGPAAAKIAWLWWLMCVVFAAVFLLVLGLTLLALVRSAPQDASQKDRGEGTAPPLGRTGFIVAGGIVLPVVVLIPILLLSLDASSALTPPAQAVTTIRVVGRMWWWEVSYPDQGIVTANEIHIPAGEPVRLELESTDVIHSLWVPSLNGKRDLIPGLTNVFWLQADEPGVYRGQCAEYCGSQHANMALSVVALAPDDYRAWLAERKLPERDPEGVEAPKGLEVFRKSGCSACHTIRGTAAAGKAAPDLTHFGSRRTIGGIILNTRGHLAGWIADPQAAKPGIRMPRTYLASDELLALTEYLESLK